MYYCAAEKPMGTPPFGPKVGLQSLNESEGGYPPFSGPLASCDDLGQHERIAIFHNTTRLAGIVVDYNREDLFRRYAESLYELTHAFTFNIIEHKTLIMVVARHIFSKKGTKSYTYRHLCSLSPREMNPGDSKTSRTVLRRKCG